MKALRAWLSPRLRNNDRGSGAAAVIIFAALFMVLAAFVIDGGLSISQRERAADIAEQAARYAAEDIDQGALRNNGTVAIKYGDCTSRVREFAQQSGLSGPDVAASGCTDAAADLVQVEIRLTYHPVLTGLFYTGALEVHGTAKAVPLTG
ncbi:TadE/TadG family type IV pilus assembly protein [Streptantibioticus ferralitis]|uniref:Pilus assembly protein TadG-related protein n=1 Tax=Streptantibioticus ferralitis TaxID=236510 RepID=A0ABT5Z3J4_9ACTN|nr:pilus assembly protein TadG-related protein [Streptantibioticus ferralitis]MDF2258402.1 pilus assembly protein TadG-related protein [Streptantibioticus ferralitis]